MSLDAQPVAASDIESLAWRSVTSSNVEQVAFTPGGIVDPETGERVGTVHVRFKGGGLYRYERVPEEVDRALREADTAYGGSVGRTVAARLVRQGYASSRLELMDVDA